MTLPRKHPLRKKQRQPNPPHRPPADLHSTRFAPEALAEQPSLLKPSLLKPNQPLVVRPSIKFAQAVPVGRNRLPVVHLWIRFVLGAAEQPNQRPAVRHWIRFAPVVVEQPNRPLRPSRQRLPKQQPLTPPKRQACRRPK